MFPIRDTYQTARFPIVNWLIIAINVFVFFYQLSLQIDPSEYQEFINTNGFIAHRFVEEFGAGQIGTMVTAMFLHGGWAHLIGNMWVLGIFGDNVEDRMGHLKYLLFYFLMGVIAFLAGLLVNEDPTQPSIGASGAIAGILGAYCVLFPNSKVMTFVPIFFIPYFFQVSAWFFLGFWFLIQALPMFNSSLGDHGVAWWAHVGGFLAGVTLVWLFIDKRDDPKRAMYSYMKDRYDYR